MTQQGTTSITDVSVLHGDFWPEEESVEEFVATIREWRGHNRTETVSGDDNDHAEMSGGEQVPACNRAPPRARRALAGGRSGSSGRN